MSILQYETAGNDAYFLTSQTRLCWNHVNRDAIVCLTSIEGDPGTSMTHALLAQRPRMEASKSVRLLRQAFNRALQAAL